MAILLEKIENISIIIVDLDRATVIDENEFKNLVQFELDKGSEKFIFDLKSCNFIDSTFLAALVISYKKIAEQRGELRIVGFKPAVRSMFELTQLSRIFDIYEDEQQALMSFN